MMDTESTPVAKRPPRARPAANADRNPLQAPWWFASLAVAQVVIGLTVVARQGTGSLSSVLIVAVALSLSFDNTVIACGRRLESSRWLTILGQWRYVLHIVITPMLLPLAVQIGQSVGLGLGPGIITTSWIVTGLWIAAALWVSFRNLELRMVREGQVSFQKNNSRHGQPWIDLPYVVLVLVILLIGAMSPLAPIRVALLSGGLAMLVSEALAERWGRSISNLGEMALLGCLVIAAAHLQA